MSQTLRGASKPGVLPRLRIFLIGLLVSFALPAVDGNANWHAEWERTLKAARAEGSVAVYATSSVGNLDDRLNSLREDLPQSIIPELAMRKKGRKYVFINQPSWADFRPIFAILKEARRKTRQDR